LWATHFHLLITLLITTLTIVLHISDLRVCVRLSVMCVCVRVCVCVLYVGSTTIDIEDRWFSKSWRKMAIKPLERRTLKW